METSVRVSIQAEGCFHISACDHGTYYCLRQYIGYITYNSAADLPQFTHQTTRSHRTQMGTRTPASEKISCQGCSINIVKQNLQYKTNDL